MLNSQENGEVPIYPPKDVSPDAFDSLIAEMNSPDGATRKAARRALVEIGEPAVDALIAAVSEDQPGQLHWELVKALVQIGSPRAAQTFVEAMQDDDYGIHWLGAKGLIAIGPAGLRPLLLALEFHSNSSRLRQGAHHVLSNLVHRHLVDEPLRERLRSVLDAFDDIEPSIGLAVAAYRALQTMRLQGEGLS